ncbi:MAG: DNRLRE domain-containing protein, partial [Hadesarchaea archaeon]|nr:DNRLRE domain-containing protein [Hadesarchaea archaeon]
RVIISMDPIEAEMLAIKQPKANAPPEFYGWAKENQIEAAAVVAAYCYAQAHYPPMHGSKLLDIIGYAHDGEDILARVVYRSPEYSRPRAGSWVQSLQEDFEACETENLDVKSSPGDVRLQATFKGTRIYLRPTDDASVYEKYPSANYGSHTSIWVTLRDKQGYRNWGFLKFKLEEVPSTVVGAKLHLHCWKLELDEFVAACHEVAYDDWSERAITWNNKPAHGNRLDAIPITGAGWYVWNVTDFIRSEIKGDRIASFCLKGAPEVGYRGRALFDSKEWQFSDKHPYLEITYMPKYASTGRLTSQIFDAGDLVEWEMISWTSEEPSGTHVEIEVCTSSDNMNWSGWQACKNGAKLPLTPARFIRYRATLRTDNIYTTPTLREVIIHYKTLAMEEELATLRVTFERDDTRIGKVNDAWLVHEVSPDEWRGEFGYNPSVLEALSTGWLYLPSQVLEHLRARTWVRWTETETRIYPSDDAFLNSGSPNANYGSSAELHIRDTGANNILRRSVLKFNLSTIPTMLGGRAIKSATLRLYCLDWGVSNLWFYVRRVADDSWSEAKVTWSSKPTFGDVLAKELQGTWERFKNTWRAYDVTSYVMDEHAGDGMVSFGLDMGDISGGIWPEPGQGMVFSSKEGLHPPYLNVLHFMPSDIVLIPEDAVVRAGVAVTDVGAYPLWRVQWENYIIYYQMMPWFSQEETRGFVFQSEPYLEPLL